MPIERPEGIVIELPPATQINSTSPTQRAANTPPFDDLHPAENMNCCSRIWTKLTACFRPNSNGYIRLHELQSVPTETLNREDYASISAISNSVSEDPLNNVLNETNTLEPTAPAESIRPNSGQRLANQLSVEFPEITQSEMGVYVQDIISNYGEPCITYLMNHRIRFPENISSERLISHFEILSCESLDDDPTTARIAIEFSTYFFPTTPPLIDANPTLHFLRHQFYDQRPERISWENGPVTPDGQVIISIGAAIPALNAHTHLKIERGQEFQQLSKILQEQPEKRLPKVSYTSNHRLERAIDFGGPSRELFTYAFHQALATLTIASEQHGGSHDFDNTLSIECVQAKSEAYIDLGRMIAYVVEAKTINLPPHLSKPTLFSILILSHHVNTQTSNENVCSHTVHPDIVKDVVYSLLPGVFTHTKDALKQFERCRNIVDNSLKNALNLVGAYLEQEIGVTYNEESNQFQTTPQNTRFLQLITTAKGFNSLRRARIQSDNHTFPIVLDDIYNAIIGTSDFKRALSDPSYESYFKLNQNSYDDQEPFSQADLNIFETYINRWAKSATKEMLHKLCIAIISSETLPDKISNSSNRINFIVENIPSTEFALDTCCGTVKISPRTVHTIVQQEHNNPNKSYPSGMDKLFADIVNESNSYNTR